MSMTNVYATRPIPAINANSNVTPAKSANRTRSNRLGEWMVHLTAAKTLRREQGVDLPAIVPPNKGKHMSAHASSNGPSAAAKRSAPGRLRRWVLPIKQPKPINPDLLEHAKERADYEQNRIADKITAFSGSMAFVYIHILWFGSWIGFGVEKYPFGLLTMIVSLEAIFLSTFVMISQNRADAKRQVLADQQWRTVQEEDRQNKHLLELSEQILALTKEVRGYAKTAQADHEQNEQLLELSKRILALQPGGHGESGETA